MATQSRFDRHILIDNRQVRIDLSSTFSDMQEERTALLKTFDALRIKARRRNVDLTVLDLRWGVTDEEARSGKVVSVCLNEIEHSHPFFIGLLGSRYGYAPEAGELDKNPDLLERYPWLADDIAARRSITEMEMLYGVLRNEGNVDAAFYIRQNGTPDDDPRQTALKERIRGQQRYPVADYASVDELCTMVEREVTALLDRHFPDVEATPLERERTAHRAYANSLLGHFVGRDEELGWLDAIVRSTWSSPARAAWARAPCWPAGAGRTRRATTSTWSTTLWATRSAAATTRVSCATSATRYIPATALKRRSRTMASGRNPKMRRSAWWPR